MDHKPVTSEEQIHERMDKLQQYHDDVAIDYEDRRIEINKLLHDLGKRIEDLETIAVELKSIIED